MYEEFLNTVKEFLINMKTEICYFYETSKLSNFLTKENVE